MEFYDDKIYSYKMKKDNFDLRQYLVENKMTENSRGETRLPVGECFLDTRILSEMRMPADPDQLEEGDPYDHHDPDYDEDWAAHQGADMADAYNDAQMDAGIDEGGVPDLDTVMGEIPSDLQSDQYFKELISANVDDEGNPLGPDMMYFAGSYRDLKQSGKLTGNIEQDLDNICATGDEDLDECGLDLGGDIPLDEAGYTDDDDWQSDDLDLDDRGGASLLDLVRGDKKAGRARKAAAADTAADPAMDDEPVDTDAPEIDDPEGEEPAGTSDPNAEAQPGLSAQVKYNPNTVEMMMDDQELDQYLSGFKRPQVAVNVLNRAIRAAQDEVNESIGLKHLYIILENGFYVTSRSQRGQVIAKVTADQAWRDKNFS